MAQVTVTTFMHTGGQQKDEFELNLAGHLPEL